MALVKSTEHFSEAELRCRCGFCDHAGMDATFMGKVERIRVRYAKPLKVNSAHRCPRHNANVSSTGADGPHTTRHAIDFGVSGADAKRLAAIAEEEGMTGIGYKQHGPHAKRFVHLDDLPNALGQPRPWVWSYP